VLLCCSVACASLHAHHDEHEIPLTDVPAAALAAAERAVPGIRLTEAEVETEGGRLVYELEGFLDGKEYAIEVTADGDVLEVEVEVEVAGDDDEEDEDDD
jgi:uncharacterized membrane protein YkoI